jgi:hypothetical protein
MMLTLDKLWGGTIGEEILKFKGREESRERNLAKRKIEFSLTTKAYL